MLSFKIIWISTIKKKPNRDFGSSVFGSNRTVNFSRYAVLGSNRHTPTHRSIRTRQLHYYHSCRKDGIKRHGVAIIVEKQVSKRMLSYEYHNERLLRATFDTVEGPITIFQVYDQTVAIAKMSLRNSTIYSKAKWIPSRKKTWRERGDGEYWASKSSKSSQVSFLIHIDFYPHPSF